MTSDLKFLYKWIALDPSETLWKNEIHLTQSLSIPCDLQLPDE